MLDIFNLQQRCTSKNLIILILDFLKENTQKNINYLK